jgi:N-dimethylarginine dimethylaminohydrolase
MLSSNEWDTLKTVIVGDATGAKVPDVDISLRTVNYADIVDDSEIPVGPYPQQVIDEANEDLEIFCNFLKEENVTVLRPENIDPEYYNYCPRDGVLVYKDLILATPQPLKSRRLEYLALDNHLKNHSDQANYIIQRPEFTDELYNTSCIKNKDVLALNETEPSFDAANILRCNDDLYYLVSNSGNKKGAEYLQSLVGDSAKVHTLENIYSYMHLDSTIAFLREGLMLLNPSRIKDKSQLPKPLQSWDIVWAPEPIDIGHYPGYCNASIWMNMNVFSINPNLIVVEEHQEPLRKLLEDYNIDCVMLPMRHERTLGGGFHCVTLDLIRN